VFSGPGATLDGRAPDDVEQRADLEEPIAPQIGGEM
jgi:hypothetical protein